MVAGGDFVERLLGCFLRRRIAVLEMLSQNFERSHPSLAALAHSRLGQCGTSRRSKLLQIPAGLAPRRKLVGVQLLNPAGDSFTRIAIHLARFVIGEAWPAEQGNGECQRNQPNKRVTVFRKHD
jgi:hypothetical protein